MIPEKNQAEAAAPQRFLRRRAVEQMAGVTRSTLYAAMAEGRFPKPVKVTRKAVAWLESEIVDWQRRRVAERDRATSAEVA